MATEPPCCGGAGGRYEQFNGADGSLHSRWVKCATCYPELPAPPPVKRLVIGAIALFTLVVLTFAMCEGPEQRTESPSYLPQRSEPPSDRE